MQFSERWWSEGWIGERPRMMKASFPEKSGIIWFCVDGFGCGRVDWRAFGVLLCCGIYGMQNIGQ